MHILISLIIFGAILSIALFLFQIAFTAVLGIIGLVVVGIATAFSKLGSLFSTKE